MSLKSGEVVKGVVSGITKYGAFIKLAEDKIGLCHISEISNEYVKDVNDYLKEGQEISVKILRVKEDNKIELSIKALEKKPSQQNRSFTSNKPKPKPKPKESFENMLTDFLKNSDERIKSLKQREMKF
ncbi:S1 RNA-binding domain-containing protein [Irregularibacter muris]|uniref:S1 RNA-binding domain-containing protein n=1 Tax=Irregularibacter muris TaxID=1796619 RepID=A0AAE3HEX0_9FIRM|nr:S1 RNA-binding domain-containing protein [Irregularibacter muris]MCR1899316.1 S1 RNA-binding domain-containing protein [Irregularibacter muris]